MKKRLTGFLRRIFRRRSEDRAVKASEQGTEQSYRPVPGQKGKNVEWAPCSMVVMNRMFEIARVTDKDYVIDPGSGDGRIVIGAAGLGAQAMGIEYDPRLIGLSRKKAEEAGVGKRAVFVQGDFLCADFSRATVVTLFLREDLNVALRPRLLNLRPGTRIISNIFNMREWQADEVVDIEDEDYYFKNHTVYLWIVPEKVGGTWRMPGGELYLEQGFQMIKGTLRSGNITVSVSGRMTGCGISFTADGREYEGIVRGDLMEGIIKDGRREKWKAVLSRDNDL